ncbi:MAG: hypothetical protein AB7U76_12485 [Pirellulales bacterium]
MQQLLQQLLQEALPQALLWSAERFVQLPPLLQEELLRRLQ